MNMIIWKELILLKGLNNLRRPVFIKMLCFSKMSRTERQKKVLEIYNYWQDNLERRMAAVSAAKEKLAEQIERDTVVDK